MGFRKGINVRARMEKEGVLCVLNSLSSTKKIQRAMYLWFACVSFSFMPFLFRFMVQCTGTGTKVQYHALRVGREMHVWPCHCQLYPFSLYIYIYIYILLIWIV